MEKDTTILKSLIEDLKREEKLIGYDAEIEIQALENLIKAFRELEERNSILNESNNLKINKINELEKENQSYRDYLGEPPCYDNAKYIPKSKLQEKKEELEEKKKRYGFASLESNILLNEIRLLNELMEDK